MANVFVTNELTLNKTAQKRVDVATNTEFFTYDQKTAKKIIHFQLEGEELDLTNANIILGFYFVNADSSFLLESADGSVVVEEPEKGLVSVMLPNALFAYSGQVLIHVYVEFENGQSLDFPAIVTDFKESWIDQELEPMADYYVKRFEDLRKLVFHQVEELTGKFDKLEREIDTFSDAVLSVTGVLQK
ncbi:protein of unknown function [Enterococcus casseliflavus]|uniref:BppU family phage baseplate upper protein n=1 Tax=Enterococcus casseliflavus TaxID=37734 RepID=UPI0008E56DB5|nr:BppU family phage baseplate upper protein [Enterococcus casseliflavus]SFD56270.1 protein of unknown function [Enterococcus casseliflavus]